MQKIETDLMTETQQLSLFEVEMSLIAVLTLMSYICFTTGDPLHEKTKVCLIYSPSE